MVQYLKRNRITGMLIYAVGTTVVIANIVYLMGTAETDVVGSAPSRYGISNESTGTSNLFPPLDVRTVSEFVSITFPMAESQAHEDFRGYDRYVIFGGQEDPIGYVYEIQDDLRCPVCNNIRLYVALDAAGEIKEIQALEPLELSGEPLPVEDEIRFLRQFISDRNEPSNGPSYVLGENVDGITGATKSSIHIVDALNKLLITHRS